MSHHLIQASLSSQLIQLAKNKTDKTSGIGPNQPLLYPQIPDAGAGQTHPQPSAPPQYGQAGPLPPKY
jgi:hypothetical protein